MRSRPDFNLPAAEMDRAEGREEVIFTEKLLEAWMWDSRNTGLPRQTPTCTLARFAKSDEPEAAPESVQVLDLDDRQFLLIDHGVGRLPIALRRIVWVEYASPAPQTAKAKRMHLSRLDYRARLLAAQWAVYAGLLPDVERWRNLIARRVEKAVDRGASVD